MFSVGTRHRRSLQRLDFNAHVRVLIDLRNGGIQRPRENSPRPIPGGVAQHRTGAVNKCFLLKRGMHFGRTQDLLTKAIHLPAATSDCYRRLGEIPSKVLKRTIPQDFDYRAR